MATQSPPKITIVKQFVSGKDAAVMSRYKSTFYSDLYKRFKFTLNSNSKDGISHRNYQLTLITVGILANIQKGFYECRVRKVSKCKNVVYFEKALLSFFHRIGYKIESGTDHYFINWQLSKRSTTRGLTVTISDCMQLL